MKIDAVNVGLKSKPYIIAEMSGNHNQSLDRALRIVDKAAEAGADAVKLQTYTADTMTLDIAEGDFYISDNKSLWKGNAMHSLYKTAYTPWEWHREIMERARSYGMACFSSPFDESAVDFLETLDVPAYKIASFECVDLPLIKRVAQTGKPMIISTGMATLAEIDEAVETARENGCRDLAILKCTSTYPASPKDTNLKTVAHMRGLYECEVGLSDHTLGIGVSVAAVAFGATIIEKHFTLSREEGGVDAAFSLEPAELASLVIEAERAWQSLGKIQYGPVGTEEKARLRRRSLYVGEDMQPGDVFTKETLRRIRPGHGLPPKYYDVFLGKKVQKFISKGTPVTWDIFD